MKRRLCFLLIFLLLLSLSAPVFADEVLFCRICGRQIPVDSNVCPYCGTPVVHVSGGSVQSASPAAGSVSVTASEPVTVPAARPSGKVPGPFGTTLGVDGAINNQAVRITKSPTSESVPYGGSCMFIAHALNARSVTWYISNASSTLILPADEAAANVSGLYASGTYSDTLTLSGIPSWMDGCKVQACFEGEGGPVYTDVARIWTYEEQVYPAYTNPWNETWATVAMLYQLAPYLTEPHPALPYPGGPYVLPPDHPDPPPKPEPPQPPPPKPPEPPKPFVPPHLVHNEG